MLLFAAMQNIETIKEKIAEAPDKSYEIGVFIGTMLPFLVLATIAYLVYRYSKNKINKD